MGEGGVNASEDMGKLLMFRALVPPVFVKPIAPALAAAEELYARELYPNVLLPIALALLLAGFALAPRRDAATSEAVAFKGRP